MPACAEGLISMQKVGCELPLIEGSTSRIRAADVLSPMWGSTLQCCLNTILSFTIETNKTIETNHDGADCSVITELVHHTRAACSVVEYDLVPRPEQNALLPLKPHHIDTLLTHSFYYTLSPLEGPTPSFDLHLPMFNVVIGSNLCINPLTCE